MAFLMASTALSSGMTLLILKNAVCMIMLMRAPRPISWAMRDRVDHVELDLLVDDLLLDFLRQRVPDLVGRMAAGQQERAALLDVGEHVVLLEEARVVAGDEVGLRDQIRARGSGSCRSAGARPSPSPPSWSHRRNSPGRSCRSRRR